MKTAPLMKAFRLARPLIVGALLLPGMARAQTYSRTEVTAYHDNTTVWVLGQTASVTCAVSVPASTACDGDVMSSATFDANTAQQLTAFSFGKLQQTLTYNVDGTIATVKDGNNNVTTLSNWKRGIPQSIHYSATAESPSGATESAVVNDNGWIDSVTDENGYKTCYGYDAMGRLSSITYPSEAATGVCDTSTWAQTTQVFEPVAAAEYGIAAGHWRQTVTTGNGQKISYYDALWRPLVTREYDAANVAGTQRFQRFAYDHEGRTTFASYPGTMDALATGTWTDYDTLGRVTSVGQDTELTPSLQVTTTEYLTGFQTRTTNPRGYQTVTSYQTFDQPSYGAPVAINHPEGAYTEIYRDALGKPTAIRRRNGDASQNVWRNYVYDGYQQLCKAIEPEVGSTVMDYDAAGNLAWSAAGQALPDTGNCNRSEAYGGGRRVDRTYDARNRLKTLLFLDGRGNQSWAYAPDGVPSQITTYNEANNGAAVVNSYVYNKRRLLTGETSSQPGWYSWGAGYGYNANGQLASQSYPNGLTATFSPNALGQPTQVADTGGQTYASGISYYPNGSIKQFTYGNGIVHTMTQNARQLPARSTDAGVIDYENSFDANGNATAILDRVRGDTYSRWMTYDGLDRLTDAGSCSFGGDCWHRFTYNALDNLKSWKLAGVKDYADYVYDASNRLMNIKNSASATIVGLDYDVQGNLRNKNGQIYYFDYGNRLREASGKETYRYDGHGRRVTAWSPALGNIVSQYSQAGQLLYQSDERQAKSTAYLYLGGSLIARVANSTAPATPVLTVPGYNTTGSYTVSWTTVASANSYELQEAVSGGAWQSVYSGAGSSYATSGKPAGNYGYRIRACLNAGCSGWSGTSEVAVQFAPGSAPSLSAPATATGGNYTVSWTAVGGATTYALEESINGGGWSGAYNGAGLSQGYSSKPAGSYTYRVKACNPAGCGSYSATATVQALYAPGGAPTMSAPATNNNGAYTVSWTAVGGATSYEVEESANGGGWSSLYSGGAGSVAVSGRGTGSYGYRARACNSAGCGGYSAAATTQVTLPPSGASSVTAPATSSTGSYNVSWTAVGGATAYQLEENVNGGAWSAIYSGGSTAIGLTGRGPATYSYRVVACNAGGCGPYSATASTTVSAIPDMPANLTGSTELIDGTRPPRFDIDVFWSVVSGATYYELQQGTAVVYSGPNTSWSSVGTTGKSYSVRACNASGCSAWKGPLVL